MENLACKQLGPYHVITPLGEGGMAAIYRAYQPVVDRYVALKVLPRQFTNDPQFLCRFHQEARLLARLQHPHILPIFDFGEADGYTYIVMPFVRTGTLASLLTGQPLPLSRVRDIIAQLGDALDYAHTHGVIHRDVKPSNVLLDERGNCVLTDFGIAKMVEGAIALTLTGGVVGTPAYMSPEQGFGQKLDNRTDIYSLGIILYELVTGRPPYKAETPMAVILKRISDPLPPARSINPGLPEALEDVIQRALARNPDDRFSTAREMVQALQAAIPEEVTASHVTPLPAIPAPGSDPATIIFRVNAPPTRPRAAPTRPRTTPPGWALAVCSAALLLGAAAAAAALLGGPAVPPVLDAPGLTPAPLPSATPAPTLQPSRTAPPASSPTALPPISVPAVSIRIVDEQDGLRTGVTRSFVADVWAEPRIGDPGTGGDRQTQLVMGEHVLIVGETDLWYQILAPEQPSSKDRRGYPGWVQKSDILAGWPAATEYAVVMEPVAPMFDSPGGVPISELPLDARFPVLEQQDTWVRVYLPDGAYGWVNLQAVRVTADLSAPFATQAITLTASKLLGTPYLWGGTSVRGVDCSGFIYRVFHAHGITLARDSRDMAADGPTIPRRSLLAGDLLFTSGRPDGVVSHAALYLGDGQVIQPVGVEPVARLALESLLQAEPFVSAARVMP